MLLRRHLIAASSLAALAVAAAFPVRAADMEKTSMALPAVAPIFANSWVAQDAGSAPELTQAVVTARLAIDADRRVARAVEEALQRHGRDTAAPALLRDAVDALLGIAL